MKEKARKVLLFNDDDDNSHSAQCERTSESTNIKV